LGGLRMDAVRFRVRVCQGVPTQRVKLSLQTGGTIHVKIMYSGTSHADWYWNH
jgi:hypothetical protein